MFANNIKTEMTDDPFDNEIDIEDDMDSKELMVDNMTTNNTVDGMEDNPFDYELDIKDDIDSNEIMDDSMTANSTVDGMVDNPFDSETDTNDTDSKELFDGSDTVLNQGKSVEKNSTKKKHGMGKLLNIEEDAKISSPIIVTRKTIKTRKTAGKSNDNIFNSILQKVEVALNRKLGSGITNYTVKREKKKATSKTDFKTNNDTEHTKQLVECKICREKLQSEELLKVHIQEHINSEGCFACQYCDDKFYKHKWQLGQHMEREHNTTSSVENGQFSCPECGYIFQCQNHLDQHRQTMPDCKNEKPAKEKEKIFLDSVTTVVDLQSGHAETKKWYDMFYNKNYPATCELCGKTFAIRPQYQRHMWSHTNLKAHKCFICGSAFMFGDALLKHLRIHNERPFHCKYCHFKFDTQARWEYHVTMTCRQRKDKPDLICSECGRQFPSLLTLQEHKNFHSGEPPRACDKCDYPAKTKSKLTEHKRVKHREVLPFKCNLCGLMFAQNHHLANHMKKHEEKKFECKICRQKLVNEVNLELHMKKIHKEKRLLPCDQCDAVFSRPVRLQEHLRQHTGEKPWTCETCGMSFFRKYRLSEHMRTHTQERPCTCPDCGKTFKTAPNLRIHRQSHKPDKCFMCEKCGQTFKSLVRLSLHRRIHKEDHGWTCIYCELKHKSIAAYKTHLAKVHPDCKEDLESRTLIRLHKCELCGKVYSAKKDLRRHYLIHQGLKPFQCSFCEKSFNDKSNLQCHERMHKDDAREICNLCSKTFIRPGALKLHLQNVHGQLTVEGVNLEVCVKKSSSEESAVALDDSKSP